MGRPARNEDELIPKAGLFDFCKYGGSPLADIELFPIAVERSVLMMM